MFLNKNLNIFKLPFYVLFYFVFSLGCAQQTSQKSYDTQDSCLQNQMALDIGSGSTKVLVGLVDTCLHKIIKIHWQDSLSLKIKESLKNQQNRISKDFEKKLILQIEQWKKNNNDYPIQTYKAVATEVFRQAKNGEEFIKQLSQRTQIPIRMINQKEESQIGFWSALTQIDKNPLDIVVWDIGGGSMQITQLNKDNQFESYLGQLASVSFKDIVLGMKKSTNPKNHSSPNPLGAPLTLEALKYVQIFAQKNVPLMMKEGLKNKTIIGISGVHNQSILARVRQTQSQDFYTLSQLEKTLEKVKALNDQQLGGDYPETDVTNLILISGFMEALGIKRVEVVSVNLTFGLLIMPPTNRKM